MLKNYLKKDTKYVLFGMIFFLIVYLVAAFFLKSEYPLSNHTFSGKDAYDALKDALGLVSPFAIAYIIYQIWHSQKGKEVIAHEARELIKDYLEYTTHLLKLLHTPPKINDELIVELEKIKNLRLKIFRGLQYFTECMNDEDLDNIVDIYGEKEGLLEEKMDFMGRRSGLIQFRKDLAASEHKINELLDSIENVIEVVKPYSTYRKRFTFK